MTRTEARAIAAAPAAHSVRGLWAALDALRPYSPSDPDHAHRIAIRRALGH